MNHIPYSPNERIVDRAVELWKRALVTPTYRAEAPGHTTPAMAQASAIAHMLPRNTTPDVLDAFGAALKVELMTLVASEHDPDYTYFMNNLCVDYDPCHVLLRAAKSAGLKVQFPWKSYMTLAADHLSFSVGYGADQIYHYPMPNGQWLVTSLRGRDMDKVIRFLNGGDLGLTVELGAP